MALDHLFTGNALAAVDQDGCVFLPAFVRISAARRSDAPSIIIGPHEVCPCLTGYPRDHGASLQVELERRRLRDESLGLGVEAHHARARLFFGAPEEAPVEATGRMLIPAMMRRKGRIGALALFVGAGATFEMWSPDVALESGEAELRELAAFRLEELALL